MVALQRNGIAATMPPNATDCICLMRAWSIQSSMVWRTLNTKRNRFNWNDEVAERMRRERVMRKLCVYRQFTCTCNAVWRQTSSFACASGQTGAQRNTNRTNHRQSNVQCPIGTCKQKTTWFSIYLLFCLLFLENKGKLFWQPNPSCSP